MRVLDIIKISQTNLLRSKLRTFLTIAAVFIGALTLSMTNGLGNGIKGYVNRELGNLGTKNTLIVQAKQGGNNPISSDVVKYNPDKKSGTGDIQTLLSAKDLDKIRAVPGIVSVIPEYNVQLEYVTTGKDKYEASATQYIEGLNLQMAAGRTLDPNSTEEISIPIRYVKVGQEQDVVGKYITIAYKNSVGKIIERDVKVVGVQQQSLLGNSAINISPKLAQEIYQQETAGIPSLTDSYMLAIAKYDSNYGDTQVTELKSRLDQAGYAGETLADRIGTISKIINAIIMVLNIFGIITLLAATFGIVNTLLMSVNERTSEIGLMKALGANRRTIFTIFALEATSIGFWGALLGVLISTGIGSMISRIASQNFLKDFVGFRLLAFPILPSVLVLLAIMLLAFLAGALPAVKASKLDPIKALRYE